MSRPRISGREHPGSCFSYKNKMPPCVSHTKNKQELAGQPFLIRKTIFSCFSHSTLIKNKTKQQDNHSFYCETFRNHRKSNRQSEPFIRKHFGRETRNLIENRLSLTLRKSMGALKTRGKFHLTLYSASSGSERLSLYLSFKNT